MNSRHPNIQFTREIEKKKVLSFLDINIQLIDQGFSTFVYRKLTFTGLFTNFESFILFPYKKGLIFTLLFRFFKLSWSYQIFHGEFEKFKRIVILTITMIIFLNKCIWTLLDKTSCPPLKTLLAPKRLVCISLPFTGFHYILYVYIYIHTMTYT